VKRRELITLLGGAAAWPLAARAQSQPIPIVGFLAAFYGRDLPFARPDVFRQVLSENGYVEGRTVRFDLRLAEGQFERFPALAAELVQRGVSIIVTGSPPAARAAMAATSTIPIVFGMGEDPVKEGVVESLNKPGRNITGYTDFSNVLVPKRLELLRDIAPKQAALGLLVNPTNPNAEPDTKEVRAAADRLGILLHVLNASTEAELETAFAAAREQRLGALLVNVDLLFRDRRALIAALAIRHAVPAMYEGRDFAAAGGLMSYGTSAVERAGQEAAYVVRILKGTKPIDLPVMQASKFELVINLNAAKGLGLVIPPDVLSIADEVIE
jgi:putative tryptophan/tyrosine transport system substrate-binding protein